MPRLRALVLLALLLGSLWAASVMTQTVTTPPPLFIVGRTYLVMPDLRSGELLTVVRVRTNGWVDTTDQAGDDWVLNPAQVYAIKPMPAEGQKAGR